MDGSRAPRERIARYVKDNGWRFTREALRTALLEAGYDAADVDAELEVHPDVAAPPPADLDDRISRARDRARILLLVLYGGTFLGFAALGRWDAIYSGGMPLAILGIVLAIVGAAMFVFVSSRGRDRRLATGDWGAAWAVLTVPIVLLVVLAGLCVPFARGQ